MQRSSILFGKWVEQNVKGFTITKESFARWAYVSVCELPMELRIES